MGNGRTRLPGKSRRRSSHRSPLWTSPRRLPPHHNAPTTRRSNPRQCPPVHRLARRTSHDPPLPTFPRWIDNRRCEGRISSSRSNRSRSTRQVTSLDGLSFDGHRHSRSDLPHRLSMGRSRSRSTRERSVGNRRSGGFDDESFGSEGEGEREVVATEK